MKDNTLFFHGTTVDGRRFTLAGRFINETDEILLGVSICSTTDQFVKRIGRKKAEGRLISEGFVGCSMANLYSTRFFEQYETEAGFSKNWYVGKEIDVFVYLCHALEEFTFKELKEEFNFLY